MKYEKNMKKLVVMITLLMCFMFNVLSQENIPKNNKSSFIFTTNVIKLPPNFIGMSSEKYFKNILGILSTNFKEKSEFETQKQYDDRINIGLSKLNDKFVYFTNDIYNDYIKYDIEKQTITLNCEQINYYSCNEDGDSEKGYLDISGGKWVRSNRIGQNAYGASVEITTIISKNYRLNNCAFLDSLFNTKIILPNIPVNEAKILKENLSYVVIGYSTHPCLLPIGVDKKAATFDSPREEFSTYYVFNVDVKQFWLYNKLNGKIYKKIIL